MAVETMERKVDLVSPKPQSSDIFSLPDSSDWKGAATRYAEENQRLKAQIARLIGKRQRIE